jgi:hypothetical protein
MASRVAVYTLRIMGPDFGSTDETRLGDAAIAEQRAQHEAFDARNQEVVDNLGIGLSNAEAALNDFLPEGYYAKIEDA